MSAVPSGSRNTNVGQYFFVIENLPRQYTWQDLKDLIRQEASHGVWTEMAFWPNGRTGEKGHARVKRKDEAGRLYQYLTGTPIEGKTLRVHLWDTSGDQPRFLRCNCANQAFHTTQGYSMQGTEVRGMALAGGWNVVSLQPGGNSGQTDRTTYTLAPQYAAQPVAGFSIAPAPARNEAAMQQALAAFAAMQLNPQDSRYAWAQQYRLQQASQAQHVQQPQQAADSMTNRYATSTNGLPVNTDRGAMRTEFRGVFVSGINYKARTKDIQALFSKAGDITKCEVQKDPASGKSKGKAIIQYRSAADAQQAIQLFDRRAYLGMELRVRFDTESTVVTAPPTASGKTSVVGQPIIVTSTPRQDSTQQSTSSRG